MEFYSTFVRLCNKADRSPSRVASELGLSKATVSRWKSGGGITDPTAHKIAEYFGVSVDYLLGNEKKPAVQEDDELRGLGYEKLTPANQEMVRSLIAALIKSQSES